MTAINFASLAIYAMVTSKSGNTSSKIKLSQAGIDSMKLLAISPYSALLIN